MKRSFLAVLLIALAAPSLAQGFGPPPGPIPTRVRALESRLACEITFPRVVGYRYDLPGETLTATFTEESRLSLSTADIPTKTENAPIVHFAATDAVMLFVLIVDAVPANAELTARSERAAIIRTVRFMVFNLELRV